MWMLYSIYSQKSETENETEVYSINNNMKNK